MGLKATIGGRGCPICASGSGVSHGCISPRPNQPKPRVLPREYEEILRVKSMFIKDHMARVEMMMIGNVPP